MPLTPAQRSRLDSIVLQMDQQGAAPEEVRTVVDDFLRKYGGPQPRGPQPPPEQPPLPRLTGPEGAVMRTFFGSDQPEELAAMNEAASQPKTLGQGLKEAVIQTAFGPVRALAQVARGAFEGAREQVRKAGEATTTTEKAGHYAAAALPVLGPAAASAGETLGRGDISGGLAEAGITLLGARGLGERRAMVPTPPPEALPARATGMARMLTERTTLGRTVSKRLGNRGLKEVVGGLEKPAEALGVKPPPANIEEITKFPARAERAAEDVALQNAQSEMEQAISQIAPRPQTPEVAGMKTQEGIKGGRDIGKRRAEELYKIADEVNADKLINIGDFKEQLQAAKVQISANPALRDSTLKGVVDKVLGKPPKPGTKSTKPLGLPDQVTYAQARALQKALGYSIEGTQGQLVTREVKGLSKKLWGDLTEAMEKSLSKPEHAGPTVEGGGTGALSAEELARGARGETYYRVSRSGELTYMGPQPDPAAPLRPGEGVVKVTKGQAPMVTQANGPDSEVLAAFGKAAGKDISLLEPPEKAIPAGTTTDGLEALRAANAHYREYAQLFKRGHVPKVAKAYPERVAKLIPDGGITPVRGLKEAILGQAEKFGTPAEKASAKEAWNALGETYMRQRLMKGGPSKLTENFDKVGHDVIKELYGSSPEGRAAITHLRQIGRQIDSLKEEISAASGLSPEQIRALDTAKAVADKVRKSQRAALEKTEGGIGGLSYHWTLLEALWLRVGALKVALPIEALGGFVAWSAYHPQATQRLINALGKFSTNSKSAVPAMVKLAQEYKESKPPEPPPE